MSIITIFDEMPVVLTKDREFANQMVERVFEAGAIVVLPDDAVLVIAPEASND